MTKYKLQILTVNRYHVRKGL